MARVQFQDERLQKAADEAKAAIEERLTKLDQISNNIKQLEHYLEDSVIRERVEIEFGPGAAVGGDPFAHPGAYAVGDPAAGQELGGGPAEEVREYVAWEQLAGHDRWRLMYLKTHREGYWDEVIPGLFAFDGEPRTVDHRPLIEAPSEVRLRAGDVLHELLTAAANNMNVSRLS